MHAGVPFRKSFTRVRSSSARSGVITAMILIAAARCFVVVDIIGIIHEYIIPVLNIADIVVVIIC